MLRNLRTNLCGIAVDSLSATENDVCAKLLDSSSDDSGCCECIASCECSVGKKECLVSAHSKSLAKSLLCLHGTHCENGYGCTALFLKLESCLDGSLIVRVDDAGNAITLKSVSDGVNLNFGGVRHLLNTNDYFHIYSPYFLRSAPEITIL